METRVKRYSRTGRAKRRIKKLGVKGLLKAVLVLYIKLMIKLIKWLVINAFYLLVSTSYLTYQLLKFINKIVEKFFSKLPRLMKVAIIYLLIANLGMDVYDIYSNVNGLNAKVKEVSREVMENIKDVRVEAEEVVEEHLCIYDSTSCLIIEKAKEVGMNEEQALISVAISRWETGNYTSSAFLNKNNVGGMMCKSGLINYNSLEEGIVAFVTNLKNNYFDIGLDTLEKIQPKYCPIGAKNDPQGLNNYWLSGTNTKLQELKDTK